MKKQAIALLITLFFISALSVLILKNLNDSESFLKEIDFDTTLTQLKLTNKNVRDEIVELLFKYKDDQEILDKILELGTDGIPFNYGNIDLMIVIEQYTKDDCYINDINSSNSLNQQCSQSIIDNISYSYEFVELLKKLKPISNQNQLDYFIKKYKNITQDDMIDTIKDNFSFLKQDENQTYIQCKYNATISNIELNSQFIFDLNSKNIVINHLNIYK